MLKMMCKSKKESKLVYAYGQDKPLPITGIFEAEVKVGRYKSTCEFCVLDGKGVPLIGRDTAIMLAIYSQCESLF